jgi:hypothetical protein
MRIHNSYRKSVKTENFGVAVPDEASKSPRLSASLTSLSSSERREAPRHPFIASAEETDLASGARLSARVSELSLKGCYLDTLNPFPKGTQIRLVIFHGGATFTAHATVIYPQPNMGMGVVFSSVEPEQREVMMKWLAELRGK